MPQVDIITPSLPERAHLLKEAAESVRRQSFRDVAHIIGIDERRIGPGFLRNQLVKKSSSPWLVFLDDDDLLDDQFVEWLLCAAQQQGTSLVYAPCRYPPHSPWRPPIGKFNPARLRSSNYIPVTVLMRRDLFQRIGGFQTTAPYEDWHLWLNLLNRGVTFGFFSHICWTYRLHGNPWRPFR